MSELIVATSGNKEKKV